MDNDDNNIMTLICRSCLSTNKNTTQNDIMINLATQSQDELNFTYLQCFFYCTNLSDWIGDDVESTELCMPDTICKNCLNELRIAFNFRMKCEKSDFELRSKLKKSIEYVNDDCNNEEFIVGKHEEYLDDEQQQIIQQIDDENDNDDYNDNIVDQFSQSDRDDNEEIYEKCKDEEIQNVQIDYRIIDDAGQYTELSVKAEQNQKYQQIIKNCDDLNQEDIIFVIEGPEKIEKHSKNGVIIMLDNESLSLTNNELQIPTNMDDMKIKKTNWFECDSCKCGFKTKHSLENHMQNKHNHKIMNNNNKIIKTEKIQNMKGQCEKFICEICNKKYSNEKYFLKHQLIHMEKKPENNHLCSECGKKFLTSQRLKVHMFTHTGEKNFNCDQCDKSFSTQYRLQSHKRIHTGERPYHCTICSMTFSQPNALKCHKRVHTGEKPYRCKYCDKSFSQNTILKTHMTLHTGKTVKCPDCDKKFSRASYLILHRREHTGEKPYACDRCPNRYKQKGHLDRHLDTHLGIKHKCEICGNQYTKQWSLKMHMFSHSDVKPFNCSECFVSFLRRDKYKSHMKIIHGICIENKNQIKLNGMDEQSNANATVKLN